MKVFGAKSLTGILTLLSIAVFFSVFPACTSAGDINNLPPLNSGDKENPKLDSRLNQLVSAEARGEAEAFAGQSNIELISGHVRVIIESVPGNEEEAIEAATSLGATLEARHDNLLQVVVPINSLTALAETTSVKFVHLPMPPLPGDG